MPYKDPEKRKECKKRYRDAHKDLYRRYNKEYSARHKDEKKAKRRRYYEEHMEEEKRQGVLYRLTKHREYKRVFTASGGEWVCSQCGATRENGATLCVHHRNLNHDDNRPENLVCLCLKCHSSLHGKLRAAGGVVK